MSVYMRPVEIIFKEFDCYKCPVAKVCTRKKRIRLYHQNDYYGNLDVVRIASIDDKTYVCYRRGEDDEPRQNR